MVSMLDVALNYTHHGISVIPSDPQTKLPYWKRLPRVQDKNDTTKTKATWRPYMHHIAGPDRLHYWFQDDRLNISIVCGQVSGGLVVFDFDYDAADIFPRWLQAIENLAQKLVIVRSFKGFHFYVRLRGQAVIPCQKIAYNEKGEVLIEIKGAGGIIQAPPSIHPTGSRYLWQQGTHKQIPCVTPTAFIHLLDMAQVFDRRPPKEDPTPAEMVAWDIVALPPGDDLLTHRLNRYTETSVAGECARLAKVVSGSRNDELNKSAFRLGRFVGAGLLESTQAYRALLQACQANGYISDDGLAAFRRTFDSGLTSGTQHGAVFLSRLTQKLSVTHS